MFPKYSKDILLVVQEFSLQLHSSGQPPRERCRRSPKGLLIRQLHFGFHPLQKLSSKTNLCRLWDDGINSRHTTASHHHTPSQGWTRLHKLLQITVGSTQRCLHHLYIKLEFRYLDTTQIIVNHLPHIERLECLDYWKSTIRQIHIILQSPSNDFVNTSMCYWLNLNMLEKCCKYVLILVTE